MSISITGTLVNAAAILLGGSIGLFLQARIPKHFADTIIRTIGLCVLVVGTAGAIKGDPMLLVVSLAVGAFTGELVRLEDGINFVGLWLQNKFSPKEGNSTFAEGFVVSTLLFCVGAMAIIGSIESGLGHDRSIIFTKSIMDGVTSIFLASSLGLGVLFSAAVILIYQGSIEFFASYGQNLLSDALVTQFSAVGGVVILGIGLNMIVDAKIKAANLLPSLLFAVAYYYLFLT